MLEKWQQNIQSSIKTYRTTRKLKELSEVKLLFKELLDKIERQRYKVRAQGGIDVWFPYDQPYQCQKEYINKVIECLNQGSNAMLESPTGSGKTISLLTACVAYMKHQREKDCLFDDSNREPPVTLIYCTRTHSQIK